MSKYEVQLHDLAEELFTQFEEKLEPYDVIAEYIKKLAEKYANEILPNLKPYINALHSGKEIRVIINKEYTPQRVTYVGVCRTEPLEGEICWRLDGEQYWNRVEQGWDISIGEALYEIIEKSSTFDKIFARMVNNIYLHLQASEGKNIQPVEIYPYFSKKLTDEISNNFLEYDEWYVLESEQPYIIDTIRNAASIGDFILKTFAYEILKKKYPNIDPNDIIEVSCQDNKIIVEFNVKTGETKEETLPGSCYVEHIPPLGIPKTAHEEYIFKDTITI